MSRAAASSRRTSRRAAAPAVPRPAPAWPALAILAALLGATLLAYQPAWHGGRLWDDDGHLTRAELQSADGLRRIWLEPGATQQYYPVTHTAFWLMHRAWGEDTTGYHLTTITLHAFNAWLLVMVLRRLRVPGALLAGIVVALHPIEVESVAWISELKNTLAGAFALGAVWWYLRFERARDAASYAGATLLFVLALLSKSAVAPIPAAMIAVAWWQRDRLEFRRDVVPLLPWLALGLAAAAGTAWVEHTFIGAHGQEFDLTAIGRVLLAGRAAWFYLWTLVWPANLMFIYPRWTIDPAQWWQYLFPIAGIAVLVLLWRLRARSRAPLAAAVMFLALVSPALGFVDVYPFRYSFVADHFQYLAGMPIVALAAAGVAMWLARTASRIALVIAVVGAGAVLGVLTWRQSRLYADVETLYSETLHRNPECWLCENNLGEIDLHRTPPAIDAALARFDRSLRLHPANAEAHNNRGLILVQRGQIDEAIAEYQTALRQQPDYADAQSNLGVALQSIGRTDEAIAAYRLVLQMQPRHSLARYNLATALQRRGRLDEALRELQTAVAITPDRADVHDAIAATYLALSRPNDALAAAQTAVRLDASLPKAHNNLGKALERLGRWDEAATAYQTAARLDPGAAVPTANLGYVRLRQGRRDEAVALLRAAIARDPSLGSAHFNLGNALQDRGQIEAAIAEYRMALTLESGAITAETHNNLGAALATIGRRAEARREFESALQIRPDFEDARRNLARIVSGR